MHEADSKIHSKLKYACTLFKYYIHMYILILHIRYSIINHPSHIALYVCEHPFDKLTYKSLENLFKFSYVFSPDIFWFSVHNILIRQTTLCYIEVYVSYFCVLVKYLQLFQLLKNFDEKSIIPFNILYYTTKFNKKGTAN